MAVEIVPRSRRGVSIPLQRANKGGTDLGLKHHVCSGWSPRALTKENGAHGREQQSTVAHREPSILTRL